MSLIGTRYTFNGKVLTIVGAYDGGDGPDDPPGWYYKYDGETQMHWISASALPIRFKQLVQHHHEEH